MKDKNSLQSLKNNSAGRQKLELLMKDREAADWLKEQFELLPFAEEPAPWKELLLSLEEELLLLASSSSPHIRRQAFSVLVYSSTTIAGRLIWDSLDDPDYRIRTLLISHFAADDRQKLYNRLYRIYLRDANWKTRKAARERIRKDFSDLFTINPENLEETEKIHCIELLDHDSSMDHDLAIHFLQEDQRGIALSASLYLEKEGCLDSFLEKASLSDMEDLSRRESLLKAAAACQVCSFLDKKENFQSPGAFYLAMELMAGGARSKQSEFIIEKVLQLKEKMPQIRRIRKLAVETLLTLKTTESYELLKRILTEYKGDEEIFCTVLQKLPSEGSGNLYAVLLQYMKDPAFPYERDLVGSFQRFPAAVSLKDMYDLIRDPATLPTVKKRALTVLCHYNEESTILFILENLPLFSREEMQVLGCTVFNNSREAFIKTAGELFQSCDGSVRKALMTLMAQSGIDHFLSVFEEALTDADPDSRICAVRALADLNSTASIDRILNLLYDPELQVRAETAAVLIDWDRTESFASLKEILEDPHESDTVLLSLIRALGDSPNIQSINLLVPILELKPHLQRDLIQSLLQKQKKDEIREIAGFFKKGTPPLREALTALFSQSGEKSEFLLLEILKDKKETVLHPSVSAILDQSGYVDICISKLKNRKQSIRKKAAEDLILIATPKALRGLVTAVKDISKEIRIMSIRAIESLRNSGSEQILKDLQSDPDKKVRKYTLWALEKINAGKLP